jgi:HEAT repeat protein
MNREEDQRVVAALRQRGLSVASVWALVHTTEDYSEFVPILVTMLSQVEDYDVREGIVRALSLKSLRAAAFQALVSALEDLFENMSPRADTLKWAIGNALSTQATKADGEDLTSLLSRTEAGGARQMIALAIGRIRYRPAVPVLIRLLKDTDVAGHAAAALSKMNPHEAEDALRDLSQSATGYAKKQADKALARLCGERVKKPV